MSAARDHVDEIIREGEERRAAAEIAHRSSILESVHAGEPLTIFGIRYVPERTTP